jgi:hypothetical protein
MMDDYGLALAPTAVTALRDQLAATQRELAESARLRGVYQQAVARLREEKDAAEERHREDIAAIGSRLIDEATERGWCSQYDEVVDDLNRSLTVTLPDRMRTWRVDVEFRVSAKSEEDADGIIRRLYHDSGADVTDFYINATDVADD